MLIRGVVRFGVRGEVGGAWVERLQVLTPMTLSEGWYVYVLSRRASQGGRG